MQRDVAYLRVVKGPNRGGVFVLKNLSVFEIGRVQSSHICVPDDSICSSHARIYRSGETWTFYDLNSEGGSWVNDIPVTKRELDGGEVIRLGSVELHFGFSPPTSTKSVVTGGAAPAAAESSPVGRAVAALEAEAETGGHAAPNPGGDEPTDGRQGIDLSGVFDVNCAEDSAAPVTFKLRVIDGDARDLGKCIVLDPASEYVLGRSTTCALVLNDGKVSRHHCRLEPAAGGFKVIDLNSANGSVLNGERVMQAVVKAGDCLRIGFTVVAFEVVPVPADPSPSGGEPHPAMGQP